MAVTLIKYNNALLEMIMRRFRQDNSVSLCKEAKVVTDTAAGWAVHVTDRADMAFKRAVLFIYGQGKYDRRWTSAPTEDPVWNLYCSYDQDAVTSSFDLETAPYDISVVFSITSNINGEAIIPITAATVSFFNIHGHKEAEKIIEEYNRDEIAPAERKAIEQLMATMKFIYPFTTIKWTMQKSLAAAN